MKTPRATISTALVRWSKGDDCFGPCHFVSLEHASERGRRKIDRFAFQKESTGAMAEEIERTAREDAENGKGGMLEEYWIIPYFGKDMSEGGGIRFQVPSLGQRTDLTGENAFTEGATDVGQKHQGMRHIEALARVYVGAISDAQRVLSDQVDSLGKRNQQLMEQNYQLATSMQDSLDRRAERDIAVFKSWSEEERKTKMWEGILPALQMLVNAGVGRPIFAVDSQSAEINMFKNVIRSITPQEMQILSQLSQEKYMLFVTAKDQIMKQDEEDEKRREAEAKKKVSSILETKEGKDIVIKQDNKGMARPPL